MPPPSQMVAASVEEHEARETPGTVPAAQQSRVRATFLLWSLCPGLWPLLWTWEPPRVRSHVVTTQRVPPTCWAHQDLTLLSLNPHNLVQAFTSLALVRKLRLRRCQLVPGSPLAKKPGFLKPRLPGRRGWAPAGPSQGGQSNGGPRGSTSTWRGWAGNTTPSTWNKLLFCVLVWSVHGHR